MPSPLSRISLAVLLTSIAFPLGARRLTAEVPTPEAHFGFRMGANGQLASADGIERYFEAVASQSDRVKVVDLGATTEGHRTIAAIVSAPDNIRNLERIRTANQRLSDPRTLPADEARQIAATHKAVLAIGGGIHASEVGATQAANDLLYWLATAGDSDTLNILDNVIIILIPSLNPDGHRLVVDWYNKQKGTPYEGGPMPWLYHKYAGHDINRDAFMMNMAESRNLSRFFYTNWHPQVFLTMHQLEINGPRFSAPPNVDPIDHNDDPIIWREAGLLGSAMTLELERDHHSGVVSNAIYDYYWPGYEDSAPLGHNTVCLLTEVASVKVATPVTISARELRDSDRGAPDYRPRINFPNPWPGGTWTLRDIVDYELSAVRGLLRAVALYRQPIVQSFYDMGARAIEAGYQGGPSAFILPAEQHDPSAAKKLEELLLQGGVEIHRALEPFRADGDAYPAGVDIILAAQPYRAYVKTLLERQIYPVSQAAGGLPERPYDVTGWTLPAQMGVDVRTIARVFDQPAMSRLTSATIAPAQVWTDRTSSYYVVDARGNGGAIAANRLLAAGLAPAWLTGEADARGFKYGPGSLVVAAAKTALPVLQKIAAELGLRVDGLTGEPPAGTRPLARSRVGLYKSWIDNVDEGWTRWLLEQYEFPYKSIGDAAVREGNLRSQFDVVILPSLPPDRIADGLSQDVVPPAYAGGLGDAGGRALKTFVENGGTLVSLDQAGGFAISALGLPVRDVTRDLRSDRFFGPGSIVRVETDPAQPLAYGMSPHTAGFFAFSSAYEILSSAATTTAARYGDKDVLVSGWLEGEQVIAGRPAVVQVSAGTGRVILLGFPVQHRAQSLATFRLLFNAILTSR
jgi:zinc carboxypeptidase